MSDTAPAPTCWPCLTCDDAHAVIRFLVDAFGFEARLVVAGDERRPVAHAQLAWPLGGGVMLGSRRPEDDPLATHGTALVYVVCDDPDALYERAVAAGATVVMEPHDTDYGSRDFAVRDPEGNVWSFGTYRGEPAA